MHPMPRRLFTEEEYLTIERASEFKSEYLDGEIFAMAGAGSEHGQISANLGGLLYIQFRGRPCRHYINDMRVRVDNGGLYTYPDVVAYCGEAHMLDGRQDTLLNPQLIIEVLSPSTASYDEGEKGNRYRRLESLSDHILIEQERMFVRHWSRQDNHTWMAREYGQASDGLRAASIAVEFKLADIYEGVVFPSPPAPPIRIVR